MKLDFSDLKQNKIVPDGQNVLTIFGAKETKSQNGTAMLVIDMKDAEEGFVRDNVCLEGAGAFKAKQLFNALGLSDEQVSSMEATDLIGQTVNVEIVSEEYNGTTRAKVKKYLA